MSKDSVRLSASALDIYETIYTDCPFCERLNKMGITRTPEGVLYNCFSTGCQSKGFIPDVYGTAAPAKGKVPVKARRYVGRILDVQDDDLDRFEAVFGFTPAPGWVGVTQKDEYILPIRQPHRLGGPDLIRVGEVLRQPWAGFTRKGRPEMPKAITYLQEQTARLAFYYPHHLFEENLHLVIVEDQVSAMKIAVQGGGKIAAVALLGNSLGTQEGTLILQSKPTTVSIWLDPDMNAKAFEINAEYGASFPGCRVILSDADPKDSIISEHLYD